MNPRALLLLTVRLALGGVFLVSGFQKLAAPAANFAVQVETFQLVGPQASLLVALTLPWLEFTGGVFFFLGLWTVLSGRLLWLLNSGFILLLGSSLLRRLPIEQCGCFGEAIHLTVPQMLALDAVLWALFLVFFSLGGPTHAPSLDKRIHD